MPNLQPQWEEKIRQDYKGILPQEQIEATVEYWREFINETAKEFYQKGYDEGRFDQKQVDLLREKEIRGKVENLMDIGALAANTPEAIQHDAGWENCKFHILSLLDSKEGEKIVK